YLNLNNDFEIRKEGMSMIWVLLLLIIFPLVSLITRNTFGYTKKTELIDSVTNTLIILIPIIYMLILSIQFLITLFIINLIISIYLHSIDVFYKCIKVEKLPQSIVYLQIGLITMMLINITFFKF